MHSDKNVKNRADHQSASTGRSVDRALLEATPGTTPRWRAPPTPQSRAPSTARTARGSRGTPGGGGASGFSRGRLPTEPPLETQLWQALAETTPSVLETPRPATPGPARCISPEKFSDFLLGKIEVPLGGLSKAHSAAVLALQRLHQKRIGRLRVEMVSGREHEELTFSPRLHKTVYDGTRQRSAGVPIHEALYKKEGVSLTFAMFATPLLSHPPIFFHHTPMCFQSETVYHSVSPLLHTVP